MYQCGLIGYAAHPSRLSTSSTHRKQCQPSMALGNLSLSPVGCRVSSDSPRQGYHSAAYRTLRADKQTQTLTSKVMLGRDKESVSAIRRAAIKCSRPRLFGQSSGFLKRQQQEMIISLTVEEQDELRADQSSIMILDGHNILNLVGELCGFHLKGECQL